MATNVANATNVENVYCLTSRIKSSNPKVGQYSFGLLKTKEPFETGNYWLLWDKKQTKIISAQTWAIQNEKLFVVFGQKNDQIYLRSIGRSEFKRVTMDELRAKYLHVSRYMRNMLVSENKLCLENKSISYADAKKNICMERTIITNPVGFFYQTTLYLTAKAVLGSCQVYIINMLLLVVFGVYRYVCPTQTSSMSNLKI